MMRDCTREGKGCHAVRGDLAEFTLSELLQLFALSEKTGTVTVHHDAGDSRLFLEAGRVVGWGLDEFDPHAEILNCRMLSPATEHAVRSVKPDPGLPGLAFVVRNLVEPERWSCFVQRLIEQDIYKILDLDSGEFQIVIDRIPPIPLGIELSVQQLILDGSRWEADLSELTQEGYGLNSVWERVTTDELRESVNVVPRDWLVLSTMADGLSIGKVAAELCLPDLETADLVKQLHKSRLIKAVDSVRF